MRYAPFLILAATLAACTPPDNVTSSVAAPEEPPAVAPKAPGLDCDHYGQLFDLLVVQQARQGWTEHDALDEVSRRGDYEFGGPTVDAVYGTRFGEPGSAIARSELMAACRRVAAGGTLY